MIMNLQAAIKTGKPFKMPKMLDYLYVKKDQMTNVEFFHWLSDNTRCSLLPVYAIMSEDWVIYNPPNNILSFPIKPIPANKPETAS